MPNDATTNNTVESVEQVPSKGRTVEIDSHDDELNAVASGSSTGIASLAMPKDMTPQEKRKYVKEHMAGCFRYMGGEGASQDNCACRFH